MCIKQNLDTHAQPGGPSTTLDSWDDVSRMSLQAFDAGGLLAGMEPLCTEMPFIQQACRSELLRHVWRLLLSGCTVDTAGVGPGDGIPIVQVRYDFRSIAQL